MQIDGGMVGGPSSVEAKRAAFRLTIPLCKSSPFPHNFCAM